MRKRLFVILAAAALLVITAGCGMDKDETERGDIKEVDETETEISFTDRYYTGVEKSQPSRPQSIVFKEDGTYNIIFMETRETDGYESNYILSNEEGTYEFNDDYTKVSFYPDEGDERLNWPFSYDENGEFIILNSIRFDYDEKGNTKLDYSDTNEVPEMEEGDE